jgi:hypothetical protein
MVSGRIFGITVENNFIETSKKLKITTVGYPKI